MKNFKAIQLTAMLGLSLLAATSQAAQITFTTNPFQGSTANPNDGVRTIFGGAERSLSGFDPAQDQFVFDTTAFAPAGPLRFTSSSAATLGNGANVIVLQDTDNDNNPSTAFNAGAAANLIANATTVDQPGFFIYWNSALNVNRLVYSTNLNDATADLAILARVTNPTGAAAIAQLPNFTASNFTSAAVPLPGSLALMAMGLGLAGVSRLRRAKG